MEIYFQCNMWVSFFFSERFFFLKVQRRIIFLVVPFFIFSFANIFNQFYKLLNHFEALLCCKNVWTSFFQVRWKSINHSASSKDVTYWIIDGERCYFDKCWQSINHRRSFSHFGEQHSYRFIGVVLLLDWRPKVLLIMEWKSLAIWDKLEYLVSFYWHYTPNWIQPVMLTKQRAHCSTPSRPCNKRWFTDTLTFSHHGNTLVCSAGGWGWYCLHCQYREYGLSILDMSRGMSDSLMKRKKIGYFSFFPSELLLVTGDETAKKKIFIFIYILLQPSEK